MYRVLIVEDDPMVASIDRSYVERTADFTVVAVCKNGVEALELFKTEEIDLVVLDYYTPGMNGDESGQASRDRRSPGSHHGDFREQRGDCAGAPVPRYQ